MKLNLMNFRAHWSTKILLALMAVLMPCAPMRAQAAQSDSLENSPPNKTEFIELTLQRRDPKTGEIILTKEKVDPRKVGVVVVDMWNFHWCKTSAARVTAMVPRMKPALEAAHRMGMTIFWCPSDVADNYSGTIQYQAAAAAPRHTPPPMKEVVCPAAPDGGGCTCGGDRCQGNYGWDAMNPDLHMHDDDFMPNDMETLYSLCVERGITHLIYLGVHTQICLLGKSIGLKNMTQIGFHCILARDLTDAHGLYDPEKGITPDQFTAEVVAHFEKYLAPTINMVDELKKAGQWDSALVVDPVRITPWGTLERPHFFENPITITLTTPWEPDAEIYYTLDGSEPTTSSIRYSAPFKASDTTRLRTAAYEQGRPVCLPSAAFFAHLPPLPPKPDVEISDLTPLRAVGPGHGASSAEHRFAPGANPPVKDLSNRMTPLKVRGQVYAKGMGVQAVDLLVYELKPEYDRFVALAGDDEQILSINNGSNLARYPSVVFKIFIDGKLMAQSPMMRMSEGPWRFDVKIPQNSKRISLVADDGGNGNKEDLADWVDAGFVTRKLSAR
jgi:hypothetical protein